MRVNWTMLEEKDMSQENGQDKYLRKNLGFYKCRKKMDRSLNGHTLTHTVTLQPRADIWGAKMRVNCNNVARKWTGQIS